MFRNIFQRRLQSVLQKRPPGSGGTWRKRIVILCGVILAGLILGHLSVRFVLWPQLEKSKPALESMLSARLGADITMDELQVSWSGMRPSFEIQGLRFNAADKKSAPLLQIHKISGELSWNSLYHLAPYFKDLRFQGAQINAERNAQGKISVAGIPINGNSDDFSAENWLLAQSQIQITDAQLVWQDQKNKKLNTSIHIDHFHLSNGIRLHLADITLTTPWAPKPIALGANFVHRLSGQPGNWRDWIGRFSWDVADLNLNQLVSDFPLPLNTLTGKLSSKGALNLDDGLADGGKIHLAADQLRIQLNKNDNPIEFGHIETNLEQANHKGLLSVSTTAIAWRSIDSPSNTPLQNLSPMTFRWRPPEADGEIKEFGFASPNIQVGEIALFALNLPLSKKIHQWIKASEAQGELQDLELSWSESKSALATLPIPGSWFNPEKLDFMIRAQLIDLSFVGINKSMPTVSHLSGALYSDEKQGNFQINSNQLEFELTDFLQDPKIKLDSADGVINWSKQRGQWAVNTKKLALKNADINTTLNLSYLIGAPKKPDQMTLDMDFIQAKLVNAYRYLPVGMDKDTRRYLESAFEAGNIEKGTLHIKGDPNEIPFSKPQTGEFSLYLPIMGATFKPVPLLPANQGVWSAFGNINATLSMTQSLFNVDITSANYKKVVLSDVHAQIPNVSANQLILNVQGVAQGDAPEMLDYLFASPIGKQQSGLAKNLSMTGPINLNLGLQFPLSGSGDPHIDAKIALSGNRAQWGSIPPFDNLKGKIRITEIHPEFENVSADFLGGSIKISNTPSAAGNSSFTVAGDINAGFVKTYFSDAAPSQLSPMLATMTGSASYEGLLNFNKAGSETNLKFDLRNWASSAPAPVKKSAGTPLLGQVTLRTYVNAKGPNSNRLDWSGKLGSTFFSQGALGSDNQFRQSFGIGAPASLPSQGVNLNLVSSELDLDAWRQLMSAGVARQKTKLDAPSPTDANNTHISAQVKNLTLLNRVWTDFGLDGSNKEDGWQFRLTSTNVAGRGRWHDPSEQNPAGLLNARLSKLKMPDEISAAETTPKVPAVNAKLNQITTVTSSDLKPNSVPSLNVTIDDFSWSKAQLGNLKIKTHTNNNVLEIESIQIANPQGNSTTSGQWSANTKDGTEKSTLNVDIDIKDAGEIVSHWTDTKSIEGGKGKLSGKIEWDGSPFAPKYDSLSGNVNLYLEKGRLLEVNSDAAKLLNVLSLQSLFRFATLDLQGSLGNIVTKGTPFNSIASTFAITKGIANTNQFTMDLDQARVAMTGQINLPNETQDLRVTVFPTLDATAGSIVAAFVVNPIVGLSALVGQYLITNQINRSLQSDYLIQGSWANPEVIPLDQKGQPLDPKTLETIRAKALLKEQVKPSAPNGPSAQPLTTPTGTPS